MESKWKTMKFAPFASALLRGFLWGGLLSLGVILVANFYTYFLNFNNEFGNAQMATVLYIGCPLAFVWGVLFGFFFDKKSSTLEGINANVLKKVLTHIIGWPLLFVAIYWCLMEGGRNIAWDCVRFISSLANIDEYKQTQAYWILVIASHTITMFFLSFPFAYFFSMFLFKERKSRVTFSLMISLSCALFVLWFVISIVTH